MEKSVLFQPTGEIRRAKPREWLCDGTVFAQNPLNGMTNYEYPIYTRHEIPAEVAQRMLEEAR